MIFRSDFRSGALLSKIDTHLIQGGAYLVKISAEVWSSKILLSSSMIVSSLFLISTLALATAVFISENVAEAEVAEAALDSSREACESRTVP